MRHGKYILAGLVLLLVAHHDFWNWDDPSLYLGIPVGLAFHSLLCLAASLLFTLLVLIGKPSRARKPSSYLRK